MNRIKKLRVNKGWNQKALAKRLGLTNQQVCLYETDRLTPSLARFLSMAKLFKCPCYWLITGERDVAEFKTRPAMQKLHKRLVTIRTEIGADRNDVADAIGTTRNQIYRHETGRQVPHLKQLLKLAQYFECNFYWLATGRKEAEQSRSALAKNCM